MGKRLSNYDLAQNELQNAVLHVLGGAPSAPKLGQVYTNSTNKVTFIWNGTSWRPTDAGALTDGSIPFDPRPCAEARRNGGEIPLHLACGYDWRDEDRLYRAIEAWAPYLARPLRGLSPERFAMAAWGLEREADAGPRP